MGIDGKRVVLIIGGGIAAYKTLDLIRRLRERGASVRPIMTGAAGHFVTPLAVETLAAERVFIDLFSRADEHDVGHIRLAREADAIVVAPATADLMARSAQGLAGDLAAAVLLAARVPVLMAPAMNPAMWANAATMRNRETLRADGVHFVGPDHGEMAESGEAGLGRMSEPLDIVAALEGLLAPNRPLSGRTAIVTSGPTYEPIDPVRYLANRSSGRQGHAIAAALAARGAAVTLISGPVSLADPAGVHVIHVERAVDMHAAVERSLPADIAVMAAAVADWRSADRTESKIKKQPDRPAPALQLVENPDILADVGRHDKRPALVIGFAAETDDMLANAKAKLDRKGCDWIVANDVSPASGIPGGVMGSPRNRVSLVTRQGVEHWPEMSKEAVAGRLADAIAAHFPPKAG